MSKEEIIKELRNLLAELDKEPDVLMLDTKEIDRIKKLAYCKVVLKDILSQEEGLNEYDN